MSLEDRLVENQLTRKLEFFGVVEDNNDPSAILRVRVRCFHYHPEDKTKVPTEDLPWAIVLQPTDSSAISGIGSSTPLEIGTWVFGFFADGENGQMPYVTHTVPRIQRPNSENEVAGKGDEYTTKQPYHDQMVEGRDFGPSPDTTPSDAKTDEGSNDTTHDTPVTSPLSNSDNQTSGALIAQGDINAMLTAKDKPNFAKLGLTTYSGNKAPDGYACKDRAGSLKFHYGTALAFEKLTKEYGKGKLYINSAYRSPSYNAGVGGAKNSQHMHGRALDISLGSIGSSRAAIARFAALAVKNGFVGFGLYNSFLHIDTGTGRTWNGAKAAWFIAAIKAAGWVPGKKGLSGVEVKKGTTEETPENEATKTEDEATTPSTNTDPSQVKTTGDAENYTKNYLASKGYNETQTAAIMGQIKNESGFNPQSYNPNDVGKPAYGLFQWRDTRLTALQNYTGTTTPNIQQQLDFFDYEMRNVPGDAGKNTYSNLMGAQNVDQASAAMNGYERFQGYNSPYSAESLERAAAARDYYSKITGNEAFTSTKGFVDPTNSLPTNEYRGEPTTNQNARGYNRPSNQERISSRDAGRLTGFPTAGDTGTFGEPELRAAPQYPFNKVTSSRTGHILEMDDTPEVERLNLEHKSGSGLEIFANGDTVIRSKGNKFDMNYGDAFMGVNGKYFMTSVNDMHIRSTADLTQQADGSVNIIVGNDNTVMISGDYVLSIGEDLQLKSGGRICIQGALIDILSESDINMEAVGDFNIKAGGKFSVQSAGNAGIKAPQVNIDDIVHMAEGLAEDVDGADTADVGKPGDRKVVEKDNLVTSTNSGSRIVTTDEVAGYYSSQQGSVTT